MSQFMTGVPIEMIYKTLTFLSVDDINNICYSKKLLQDICYDENFWSYYISTNYSSEEFGFNEWNKNIFNTPVLKELNIKSWKQLVNLINNGRTIELQVHFDDHDHDPLKIYLNDTIKSIGDRLGLSLSLISFSSNKGVLGGIDYRNSINAFPKGTNIDALLSQIFINNKTLFGTVDLIAIM